MTALPTANGSIILINWSILGVHSNPAPAILGPKGWISVRGNDTVIHGPDNIFGWELLHDNAPKPPPLPTRMGSYILIKKARTPDGSTTEFSSPGEVARFDGHLWRITLSDGSYRKYHPTQILEWTPVTITPSEH